MTEFSLVNIYDMNFSKSVINICRWKLFRKNLTFFKVYVNNNSRNYVFKRFYSSTNLTPNDPRIAKYIESLLQEFRELTEKNESGKFSQRLNNLRPIVDTMKQKLHLIECISSLKELDSGGSNDDEFKKQIERETCEYLKKIEMLNEQLLNQLLPQEVHDFHNNVIMEISAGVGGQEAMLFAKELFDMYCSYTDFKGWILDNIHAEKSDMGGIRHATLFITGDYSYKYLKHEAGVHRVQRVPATEKSGRLHTSTVSITVLPQPKEVDVQIYDKDLKIETKRASGAGGQHVNKTESAVRITHLPTGISVECQTDRSQIKNRLEAMRKLRAILYQKQLDEQVLSTNSARKMQVKSNLRSEKIRTYNFNQDRISDHRISGNFYNLNDFFTGSEQLDMLIEKLEKSHCQEILFQNIEEACDEK